MVGKCSKIRHMVRLRQMLRRWKLRSSRAGAPSDVPSGHVAVCVGSASRRFVVRAAHLNHPALRGLLAQAEDEYGFPSRPGPLSLPCCDESLFEHILRHISNSSSSSSCWCVRVGHRSSQWQFSDTLPLLRTWSGR